MTTEFKPARGLAFILCLGISGAAAPVLAQSAAEAVAEGDVSLAMAPEGGEMDFSEAETTLWLTDQLALIEQPMLLNYEFERSGSYDMGFTDNVELQVVDLKPDGSKSAVVTFFSGERNMWTPPFESVTGNPVLGLYLQGDTHEMDRLTEGHWRYFHRRIKTAFAETAEMSTVEVDFDGKKVPATRIEIAPFALDDRRTRYERFADKRYTITVSDQIPGYLYEVHTLVPGPIRPDGTRSDEPLIEERLVLVSAEPVTN